MFVPDTGRFTSHDWKLALAEVIVVDADVVCTSCTKRAVVWFAAVPIVTCSVVLVAVAALDNTTVVALVTDAIVVPCARSVPVIARPLSEAPKFAVADVSPVVDTVT